MYNRSSIVVIIVLMLLSQNATGKHDVEHQAWEHTEFCAAFVTADQAANVDPCIVELPASITPLKQPLKSALSLWVEAASIYTPRAPPVYS